MATQYANGKIVSDGLVLALDAADRNSYVSGSLIWNDVSGNKISCTLSGVTYDSSFGGILTWDNAADGVNFNSVMPFLNVANCSVCFWLRTTDTRFVVFTKFGSPYLGAVHVGGVGNGSWYHTGVGSPTSYRNQNISSAPALDNTWNYYTFTNCNFSTDILWSTDITSILYYPGGWEFSSGNLASFSIYNKNLSAAEILQNYNAQKSRFGLK